MSDRPEDQRGEAYRQNSLLCYNNLKLKTDLPNFPRHLMMPDVVAKAFARDAESIYLLVNLARVQIMERQNTLRTVEILAVANKTTTAWDQTKFFRSVFR